MFTTSEDFAEACPTVSFSAAVALCADHGASLEDFIDDAGIEGQPRISTEDLLGWLGY